DGIAFPSLGDVSALGEIALHLQLYIVPLLPGGDALGIFALDYQESAVAEENTQRRFGGVDDSEQSGRSRFRIAGRGRGADVGKRGARGVIGRNLPRAMRVRAPFGRETTGLDDRDLDAERLHLASERLAQA